MSARLGLAAALALIVWAGALAADEVGVERATVRTTKEKLNFDLPPDWPVERRGGLMQPVPVEEYLAMKFKSLDGRLQGMEQRLQGLDIRVRLLEERAKTGAAGLKSSEEARP